MRLRIVAHPCQAEAEDNEVPAAPDAPALPEHDWLRALAAKVDALDGCWKGALLDLLASGPPEVPDGAGGRADAGAACQPVHAVLVPRGHARRQPGLRRPSRQPQRRSRPAHSLA